MHSCDRLFALPWIAARQSPLSTEFSKQEYWSGLSFPTPRALSNPGKKPTSLVSPALASGFFTTTRTAQRDGMSNFLLEHCS